MVLGVRSEAMMQTQFQTMGFAVVLLIQARNQSFQYNVRIMRVIMWTLQLNLEK